MATPCAHCNTSAPPPKKFWTVKAVAEEFDVSPDAVRDWIRTGRLRAFKVTAGPRAPIRIKAGDVEALLIPITPNGDAP